LELDFLHVSTDLTLTLTKIEHKTKELVSYGKLAEINEFSVTG